MNSCHNPRPLYSPLAALLAALAFAPHASAVDPNRTVSQYIRDYWGPEKGFPSGPVYSIAQTTDGYLWFGTETGLVRFDALTFQRIQSAHPAHSAFEQSLGPSLGLAADDSGSLWVRLRGPTVLRYREDTFFEPPPELAQDVAVTVAARSPTGELIFATRRNGLFALRESKLSRLAIATLIPNSPVIALAKTPDGDIWLGTRDVGLVRLRNGQATAVTRSLPDLKINCLLADKDGTVWIGTDNGIVRWNGTEITRDSVPPLLQHARAFAMIQDHDANIWFGTSHGLCRLNEKGLSTLSTEFNESVTALFEDREGNLWAGGDNGIERLRDSVFASYSVPEGLPPENNGPVFADDRNRIWFAPESGGLYSLRDGKVSPFTAAGLDKDVVYSIAGRPGELWIGRQRGGLTQIVASGESFTARTYTTADGLAQNTVFAVSVGRDGTVWAGTLNGGVSRFHDRRFSTITTAEGLASDTVSSILEDSSGTMWFATPSGLSSARSVNGSMLLHTYTARDGLPSDNVNCIFEDSSGILWIGTLDGLAFLRSGRIQAAAAMEAALREQIFGIAEDRNGCLWITTANHVLRVNRHPLLGGPPGEGDVRQYELSDGLRSITGVKRQRSVVADPHGRIWLSMTRGLSVTDPARLIGLAVPAIVRIQSISADGNPLTLRDRVRIPPGPQRITLDYSGLTFAIPERTRFRYTLEGFDRGWSQPSAARQAVYTNLGPGPYRFRVKANNLDEVFDGPEATVAFEIAPAFWQTWWFAFAAVILLASAVLALVRSRMHRLTHQMNLRFEERLAERTRIAQDLHDTLLQGFLSASMQLHVAADRLPEDSAAKQPLNRVLQLMTRVIAEGRGALQDLRSSSPAQAQDLEHAFSHIQQELDVDRSVSFRVVVEGKSRLLHPLLRDEVYRIGREALVNAFRHSRATNVEVELEYAENRFRVLVRDNGCGIDPVVIQSGRKGHWGLPGMRERAERIGASLRVWSGATAGTEVELSIPGHVAFTSAGRRRSWYRFSKSQ
ncbi:MAG TPA: two-component regulator propeller domain-containing protein [Bryobacteraceae bacterium]|nr:two-component regulator propeller domain-containing protein [Bryobacteraceae bacterium]